YGYPLWSLAPYVGEGLRTPHNIVLYITAYLGWSGMAAFLVLALGVFRLLYDLAKRDSDLFFVSYWLAVLVTAVFGNVLEAPFGAIPFWLISGVGIAKQFEVVSLVGRGEVGRGAIREPFHYTHTRRKSSASV